MSFAAHEQDAAWQRKARVPGLYSTTAWIPGDLLAEGTHFVGASVSTLFPLHVHFHEPDVVAFHVVDNAQGDSARGGLHRRDAGCAAAHAGMVYAVAGDGSGEAAIPGSERAMKRILYIQYTNPASYPPLEHSSRMLADAGWQVLFLGTRPAGTEELRFPPHARIAVKYMDFSPAGWRQKIHYFLFGSWALAWAMLWRARWIYASDVLISPAALVLTWFPWLRVLYHEHDSPGDPRGGAGSAWCRWPAGRWRAALRAAFCRTRAHDAIPDRDGHAAADILRMELSLATGG